MRFDEGDLQDDDGSFWGSSDEELDKSSDLDREWERRRNQFHTVISSSKGSLSLLDYGYDDL